MYYKQEMQVAGCRLQVAWYKEKGPG